MVPTPGAQKPISQRQGFSRRRVACKAVARRPAPHVARTFAELLIDCEEDRTLRAVLVGMLREGERYRRNLRSVDKDQRWAALVEQFDPLPQELADLIQRDDTGEVLSWVRERLNASQRELDDLRFGNPRLLAQLRDALEQHVEGSELDRYREEWERRAQVCYSWVRRLLAAHAINRESSGSVDTVDLEQLERALGERLDALGPAPRAELLHVLMLPDFERADRIGEFYRNPKTRTFAELLIDCEEDRTLRAVLVGMLREA